MHNFCLFKFGKVCFPSQGEVYLDGVPHALEKNVYYALVRCFIALRFHWLIVFFRLFIALLVFLLLVLSVTERGILLSPTIIANFSLSPFKSTHYYLVYFDTLLLHVYILKVFLENVPLYHYVIFHFIPDKVSYFEVNLSDINVVTLDFFWLIMIAAFFILYLKLSMFYICNGYLLTIYSCIIIFYPMPTSILTSGFRQLSLNWLFMWLDFI